MPYFLAELSPFDTYVRIKYIIDTVPINDAKSMLKNFIQQAKQQFQQKQKYNCISVNYNQNSLEFNLERPSILERIGLIVEDTDDLKCASFERNLAIYFLVKKLDQNSLPHIFLYKTIPEKLAKESLAKESLAKELDWLYSSYTTPNEIVDLALNIERKFSENNLLLNGKTISTEMAGRITQTSSSHATVQQTIEETQL